MEGPLAEFRFFLYLGKNTFRNSIVTPTPMVLKYVPGCGKGNCI